MKLNWKFIRWNMSIFDIQNFIRIHGHLLTFRQILKLYKRIERLRKSNLKFSIALVNSDLFKAGIALIGRKNRRLSGIKAQDFVSDNKLYPKYKNEVIDNMAKIRNRMSEFNHVRKTKKRKN